MYNIKADTIKNRLNILIEGILTTQDIESYMKDMRVTVSKLKPGFTTLLDLSKTTVFSQEILEKLQETKEVAVKGGMSKSAFFVSSVIMKMQMNRNFGEIGPKDMAFNSLEEAEKFLQE